MSSNNNSNSNSNNNNLLTDPRFDLTTLADLYKECESYFGLDKPFWDQSSGSRSSLILLSSEGKWNVFKSLSNDDQLRLFKL